MGELIDYVLGGLLQKGFGSSHKYFWVSPKVFQMLRQISVVFLQNDVGVWVKLVLGFGMDYVLPTLNNNFGGTQEHLGEAPEAFCRSPPISKTRCNTI